jgi:hypothetical protein
VLLGAPGSCEVSVDGSPLVSQDSADALAYDLNPRPGATARVAASCSTVISALFLVPAAPSADAGAP